MRYVRPDCKLMGAPPQKHRPTPSLGELKPRGDRRLIYVSDPSNTTSHLGDPAQQDELRHIIRNYTLGGIDTVVQEVFAECMTMFWRTDLVPYDIRPNHQIMVPMMDRGTMPVEIYIDECHKQGMEFIAGFRMNDRHGHHPDYFKQLCEEKPDWVLREYKPSWRGAPQESHEYGCSLNYAVEGVRAFLLSIMAEVVSRFDLDGLEFNYTRLLECFPANQAAESADIMTDFIRQARASHAQKLLKNRSPKFVGTEDLFVYQHFRIVRRPCLWSAGLALLSG